MHGQSDLAVAALDEHAPTPPIQKRLRISESSTRRIAMPRISAAPKKLPALQKKRGRNRRPTRIGDGAIETRARRGSSSVTPALAALASEDVETVVRALATPARSLTPSSLF